MAKNTSSNVFRTLDVDLYSEDNYKEEAETADPPATTQNESVISSLLAANKPAEALTSLLSGPILGIKDPAARAASLTIAMRVLMAIKASQIDEVVAQLDNESRDVLMKFIYRGFEVPSEGSSAHLLVWHEKVFAVAGPGSIVRALTDKKRV
eukprot:TRINITY_DN16044_c0_g1_i1.p1 TRINITY_DN16044_c0_g1~~TRINITY_DN16044_c0_g1_i1.p1  ORF type:complete len:152 (+),score=63.09 TRINITY_DN16044_c0_g1_i1:75-530(+)